MKNPRLDRSRPFGTIHPAHHGAFYEQDGVLFDVEENAIGTGATGAAKVAPSVSEAKENPKPAGPVDLAAWAKGEKYPFFAVKKATGEQFPDADTSNAKTIVAALIAAGIVTEDEATR